MLLSPLVAVVVVATFDGSASRPTVTTDTAEHVQGRTRHDRMRAWLQAARRGRYNASRGTLAANPTVDAAADHAGDVEYWLRSSLSPSRTLSRGMQHQGGGPMVRRRGGDSISAMDHWDPAMAAKRLKQLVALRRLHAARRADNRVLMDQRLQALSQNLSHRRSTRSPWPGGDAHSLRMARDGWDGSMDGSGRLGHGLRMTRDDSG